MQEDFTEKEKTIISLRILKIVFVTALIIGALVLVGPWVVMGVIDLHDARSEKAIAKLVEKGDYAKAMSRAKSSGVGLNTVVMAQASDFIENGEFDMAAQIARENEIDDAYVDVVYSHLAKIYSKYGKDQLLYALSLAKITDPALLNNQTYYVERDLMPINLTINKINTSIEGFCEYLKSIDDKAFIPKMLAFLKPTGKIEKNSKTGEKIQKDYTEVNRIKAKFGYK